MNPTEDRLDAYKQFDLRISLWTLVRLALAGGVIYVIGNTILTAIGG